MKTVAEFAEELADAYSTDNYRNGWSGSIRMLRARKFDDQEIEAIIRSKWTRWACDSSDKRYGQNTSSDLARFLDTMPNLISEVEALTKETFA